MKIQTLKLTVTATFIAIGVAVGYALIFLPNVELVTLLIFLGGYNLGWKSGAFIGFTTEFIYSNFNLFGPAPVHILAAQLLGMLLAGIAGAIVREFVTPDSPGRAARFFFALTAVIITAVFDFLTTLADVLIIEPGPGFLVARLVAGLPFFVLHIASNGLIFFFLAPALIQILQKLPPFERLAKQRPMMTGM